MKIERRKGKSNAAPVLSSTSRLSCAIEDNEENIIVVENAAQLSQLIRHWWVEPYLNTSVADITKHLPSESDVEHYCTLGEHHGVAMAASLRSAVLNQCLTLIDYIPVHGMPVAGTKLSNQRGLVGSNMKEHYWWSEIANSNTVLGKRSQSDGDSECSEPGFVCPEKFCSIETKKKLK